MERTGGTFALLAMDLKQIAAACMGAEGVQHGFVSEMHGVDEYRIHKSGGGGWVLGYRPFGTFRVVLITGKKCADVSGPALGAAIKGAFDAIGVEVPAALAPVVAFVLTPKKPAQASKAKAKTPPHDPDLD